MTPQSQKEIERKEEEEKTKELVVANSQSMNFTRICRRSKIMIDRIVVAIFDYKNNYPTNILLINKTLILTLT